MDLHLNHSCRKQSNLYKVAKYTADNHLYEMFLYALDRDGRTYNEHDLNHVIPSNFLWTKTAILEAKGFTLEQAKKIANHHWKRIGNNALNQAVVEEKIHQAKSICEVNKVLLGSSEHFGTDGVSAEYDPIYEWSLMN